MNYHCQCSPRFLRSGSSHFLVHRQHCPTFREVLRINQNCIKVKNIFSISSISHRQRKSLTPKWDNFLPHCQGPLQSMEMGGTAHTLLRREESSSETLFQIKISPTVQHSTEE
ncbi:hypothetical protein CDAR_215871 [Caerostris darwini]|uniref:Uncharacterized protein n=1 Tax=Caerostris darwini TaxID=1538125 RepID=A0AAV4NKT0_9ARAC|nr:hypothetical protein CDAR_215871 [Caerostris darwini]